MLGAKACGLAVATLMLATFVVADDTQSMFR